MNDEYIYIKTNNVQTDMCEFVNQFGDEISYLSYPENIINRTKEFIQNKDVDVCTIRNNDIQNVKNIVLEILDNKGSDE